MQGKPRMEFPTETWGASFNTDFSLQVAYTVLLHQLEKGSNFVCSPLSLHIILGLIASGSTGNTLLQLLSLLGLQRRHDLHVLPSQIMSAIRLLERNQSLSRGPLLSFANGAWVEQSFGLKSSFDQLVKQVYKSHVKSVDFITKADQVRDEVNAWAENATNGLIKELLPSANSVNKYTKLVLVNALYFKGAWENKFDPSLTETKSFHLLNGHNVQVPFMTTMRLDEYYYRSFENVTVLKIPYHSGDDKPLKFAMYFFLPHENNGLPNLVHSLKSNPRFLNQDFGLQREKISEFWIPRFKFSSEFEAKESMQFLGLTLPFKPGELTEVSDSIRSRDLFVSKIFHKAFIEVNEEGTEASACTAPMFEAQCLRLHIPRFVADHPFMFMIREETSRAVFFVGAVLNPLLAS